MTDIVQAITGEKPKPVPELESLTPKQRDFVLAYVQSKNATEAAIQAGYSPDTARSIGSENLTKPDIQKAIEALTRPVLERKQVTVETVIAELANIGFAPDEKFQYHDKYGNLRTAYSDKIAALKALGDHAGAWEATDVNLNHKGSISLSQILSAADGAGR